MTKTNSADSVHSSDQTQPSDKHSKVELAGDDQASYSFSYGHGRMPFFMKLVWLGFLVFATWYIVTFLLESLSRDLG